MPYEVIELNELEIDRAAQARTTGWTVDGSIATHEACNAGPIYLETDNPIVTGQNYEITFNIISISGGGLRPYVGTAAGTNRTTAGFVTEIITATGTDPEFRFYSDADCQVKVFNIRNTLQSTDLKQQNTIAWSEKNNKWTSFYTQNPDCAFSMFINLYTFKQGRAYIHRNNSATRNYFFGTQYKSIITPVFNQNPTEIKRFQSIYIKANQLMITSEDGITTSLGQVSELIDQDFLEHTLNDGVDTVNIYSKEGVSRAMFMNDKNIDIVNGDSLKGQWIAIELVCDATDALKLFSIQVKSTPSFIG